MSVVANVPSVPVVPSPTGSPVAASPFAYRAAYDATAEARAALAAGDLLPINLDAQVVFTTVLGALPAITALRDAIAALPRWSAEKVDVLKPYAEALAHAHWQYLGASEPVEALPGLVARAAAIREQFVTDATALAKRGFVDGKRLADIKGGPGYLNTLADLGTLVGMLRDRWVDVAANSGIKAAELDEAERLAEEIGNAYAARAQTSAIVAKATDERQRAYTLVVQAYDQVRRAVAYLRWDEGDLEKLAPSLWSGRGRSSGVTGNAPAPAQPPTGGAGARVVPGGPGAPSVPGAPVVGAPAPVGPYRPEPKPAASFAPAGARGSNPFTD